MRHGPWLNVTNDGPRPNVTNVGPTEIGLTEVGPTDTGPMITELAGPRDGTRPLYSAITSGKIYGATTLGAVMLAALSRTCSDTPTPLGRTGHSPQPTEAPTYPTGTSLVLFGMTKTGPPPIGLTAMYCPVLMGWTTEGPTELTATSSILSGLTETGPPLGGPMEPA